MSQEHLPPPIRHDHLLPEHIQGYKPLGQAAVAAEERRVHHVLEAESHREAVDYIGQYAGYSDPRHGFSPKTFVDKLRGKNVPGKELVEWIGDTDGEGMHGVRLNHNSSAVMHNIGAEVQGHQLEMSLDEVRSTLRALDKDQRKLLEMYAVTKMPQLLKKSYQKWWYAGKNPKADFTDWLTEPDNGNADEPNLQLLNFLQWHNARSDQINSTPETKEQISAEKADFKAKVENAVAAGKWPDTVLAKLEAVDGTDVYIADEFDTSMSGKLGWALRSQGKLMLKEGYSSHIFRHEMSHVVLGNIPVEYLNEAVTEQIALALDDGNFDVINPGFHSADGIYTTHRQMVDIEMTGGSDVIPLDRLYEIYLEPDNDKKVALYQELRADINRSFGFESDAFINDMGDLYFDIIESVDSKEVDLKSSAEDQVQGAREYALECLRIASAFVHGIEAVTALRDEKAAKYLKTVNALQVDDAVKKILNDANERGLDDKIEAVRAAMEKHKIAA